MRNLYFLLISLVFISCSNDVHNPSVSLQGEWNLVNVTGGFTGIDQDFERGTII
ncbi:hypothetical protein [uncultured Aquimarina sp.]|uniref:hypothetical protein n=1 Tax=uncultured Aquimarina sp. TaxID=575652 RepID=UPI002603E14C|nr:hypothetical protein [uncultured Aquimarina sp.]